MSKRPVVIAVTSDHHCGSTVGLCPAEGVRLDDGGRYLPSHAQRWLWQCWLDYRNRVERTVRTTRGQLYLAYNGDLVDGDHHKTTQIISGNPEAQSYVATRVFGQLRELKPKHTFVIRGTEVHTGQSGNSEEAIARWLKAEKDPAGESWSWWHLRLEVYGVLFDFKHHGKAGTQPWTLANPVNTLAAGITLTHARGGHRIPDVAIRSHRHVYADTYKNFPVRVIQTPAWQLKTGYAHKVAAESLSDIGGLIVTVHPDGRYDVDEVLFRPDLPAVWTG